MEINQSQIEYWRASKTTELFMKAIALKHSELVENLKKGAYFASPDPLRESYRAVGNIRILEEILNNKIFEILE